MNTFAVACIFVLGAWLGLNLGISIEKWHPQKQKGWFGTYRKRRRKHR